jgi:hypothetical protein
MKRIIALFVTTAMPFAISGANAAITMCKKLEPCYKIRQWAANSALSVDGYTNGTGTSEVPWQVIISSAPRGKLDGVAKCTASSSDPANTSTGDYCWCRRTGQDGNNACGGSWVFLSYIDPSWHTCSSYCGAGCGMCLYNDGRNGNCTSAALLVVP